MIYFLLYILGLFLFSFLVSRDVFINFKSHDAKRTGNSVKATIVFVSFLTSIFWPILVVLRIFILIKNFIKQKINHKNNHE